MHVCVRACTCVCVHVRMCVACVCMCVRACVCVCVCVVCMSESVYDAFSFSQLKQQLLNLHPCGHAREDNTALQADTQ